MARKKKIEPWFFKYLRREIRRIFHWSPERKKSRERALISKFPELFRCEGCGEQPLTRKEVQCDHVIGCESLNGWDGWAEYIRRTLEVNAEGLQWLCKKCHQTKSNGENAERRRIKNEKRKSD
jgi:hypothetical protein